MSDPGSKEMSLRQHKMRVQNLQVNNRLNTETVSFQYMTLFRTTGMNNKNSVY
jgi:hypothetical protein